MLEIVLAALVGSLPGLLALWRFQKMGSAEKEELEARAASQKANAADKLTDIAMQWIEPMQARIADLETVSNRQEEEIAQQAEKIEKLNRKLERSAKVIQALLRGLAVLTEQLRGLDVTPAFVIPVYDGNIEYLSRVLSEALERLEEDAW